jgi:hypothetical protein
MIRRAFDSEGDYAINSFISESPATIQAVATRLRLFLGEWFLNLNDGVPWFQQVFVKPARLSEVDRIIRDTITETEGVEVIDEFDLNFDPNTRKLSCSFKATTIYGDEFTEADINGINPLGAV